MLAAGRKKAGIVKNCHYANGGADMALATVVVKIDCAVMAPTSY